MGLRPWDELWQSQEYVTRTLIWDTFSNTIPPALAGSRATSRKVSLPHHQEYEKDLHIPILSTSFLQAPCPFNLPPSHSTCPLLPYQKHMFCLTFVVCDSPRKVVDFLKALGPLLLQVLCPGVHAVLRLGSWEASLAQEACVSTGCSS